jgi:hypothetical protein
MTLFIVIFFTPTESRIINSPETTRRSFPGWDVHSICGYTPENPVVKAQKLDDTEDNPLGRKSPGDYAARCTPASVLPSLTKTYR